MCVYTLRRMNMNERIDEFLAMCGKTGGLGVVHTSRRWLNVQIRGDEPSLDLGHVNAKLAATSQHRSE